MNAMPGVVVTSIVWVAKLGGKDKNGTPKLHAG
jgi:hypothetical protein